VKVLSTILQQAVAKKIDGRMEVFGLIPHDQPVGHLVGVFARILPADSAHWAVSAGCAGS
jgi:hypothetical protein